MSEIDFFHENFEYFWRNLQKFSRSIVFVTFSRQAELRCQNCYCKTSMAIEDSEKRSRLAVAIGIPITHYHPWPKKLENTSDRVIWKLFKFFFKFSKFARMFLAKNRFRSSFGRPGTSGKSRATRFQNSSLLRCLATTKTSKKLFGKNSSFGARKSDFR